MTYANTNTHAQKHAPFSSFLGGVYRSASWIFDRIAETSKGMAAAREVERLSRLSDLELARLGLTRDRIVQHAFAGFMAH